MHYVNPTQAVTPAARARLAADAAAARAQAERVRETLARADAALARGVVPRHLHIGEVQPGNPAAEEDPDDVARRRKKATRTSSAAEEDPDAVAKSRKKGTISRAQAVQAPLSAARAKKAARRKELDALRKDKKAAAAYQGDSERESGAARPRRAKVKIDNSKLLMPFHDITDDPYFIRV